MDYPSPVEIVLLSCPNTVLVSKTVFKKVCLLPVFPKPLILALSTQGS